MSMVLTTRHAESFIRSKDALDLSTYTSAEDEALQQLVHHCWYGPTENLTLDFSNFAAISECQADIISSHVGHLFHGIRLIDETIARSLAGVGGRLLLDRVASLAEPSARALAHHRGPLLSLNGIRTMDEKVALALSAHRTYPHLRLMGLREISDDAVKGLASL